MKLTKQDIIEKLTGYGWTKKDAKKIVEDTVDLLTNALNNGESIGITGFGSLEVVETKARQGRNPRTGEAVDIPASKRVKFKPGKTLLTSVRG